jgi:hypothetical protein
MSFSFFVRFVPFAATSHSPSTGNHKAHEAAQSGSNDSI